jgi:glycosyltransferase involved in cell wall biosynthesis
LRHRSRTDKPPEVRGCTCALSISIEELVALYRTADIVVYPYRAITTSGALATGLALSKTIVASDLPVFRELLTDRENALLVDPNNSAELAAALIELSTDSRLRLQLAANVRAMHFGDESWLSIADRTKNFYSAILAQFV